MYHRLTVVVVAVGTVLGIGGQLPLSWTADQIWYLEEILHLSTTQ